MPDDQTAPGASQDTNSGTGTSTPPAPPAPSTPPAGSTSTDNKPAATDEAQDVSSLPPWAQTHIKGLRDEAAKHRTEKQTVAAAAQEAAKQRDAILKAAGFTSDGKDAPPSPEALTKQLEDMQARAWEQAAQVAIMRTAAAAGADPDALLDSNSFLDSLAEFIEDDPNSAAFRTKMTAHIKAFAAKHPKVQAAATKPSGPSGAPLNGGPGGGQKKATSLEDAVTARYAQ